MPSNIFVECNVNFNEFPTKSGILDNYTFSIKDLFDLKRSRKEQWSQRQLS